MDLEEKMNYRESCWKRVFFSSQPGNSIKHLNSFTASVKEFGKPEFLMLVRWVKHTESNTTSGREELTVSHRERVQENSPICCGVLQAQTELSMLWMNSSWPWGSHQFCMRSPRQIDRGRYCTTGSPGFPWGQTPTETAVTTETTCSSHIHNCRA